MTSANPLDMPADDFDQELDPAIYVEPKDRGTASEDARQAEFVTLMRRTARACRVFAVPNGTHIASHAGRAKRQREGLLSGEPDTGISWADAPTARIEFKNGRKMPDENQIEALNWYHQRGHPVAVCRTAEGAMWWLRSIGAPVPEVRS
jgi:hypothetical protein